MTNDLIFESSVVNVKRWEKNLNSWQDKKCVYIWNIELKCHNQLPNIYHLQIYNISYHRSTQVLEGGLRENENIWQWNTRLSVNVIKLEINRCV